MNNEIEDQDRFYEDELEKLSSDTNENNDDRAKVELEFQKEELESQKLDLQSKYTHLKEKQDQVKLRKTYANLFLVVAISWLFFVGFVIYANGISLDRTTKSKFSISDRVVITLIVSSLFNVLTPTYIVAKYLFNQSDKEISS